MPGGLWRGVRALDELSAPAPSATMSSPSRPTRTVLPRVLCPILVGLLALSSACAAGGSRDASDRLRVTLLDFAKNQRFELVSESHTDRVTYYSEERPDGARKIEADDVMRALVTELDRQGFERYHADGPAPAASHGVLTRSFEIDAEDGLTHWAVGSGSPAEERIAFNECVKAFLQLYNFTSSYQSVDNEKGHEFFEDSQKDERRR